LAIISGIFLAALIQGEAAAQQFYIIGRYYCVGVNNPARDEGDCNITTNGNSCPEAMSAHAPWSPRLVIHAASVQM